MPKRSIMIEIRHHAESHMWRHFTPMLLALLFASCSHSGEGGLRAPRQSYARVKTVSFPQNVRVEELAEGKKVFYRIAYHDKRGSHIALFSRDCQWVRSNSPRKATCILAGRLFRAEEEFWSLADEFTATESNCDTDLVAKFFPDVFRITDLDRDGLAELSVGYVLGCRSDVSPIQMAVILYEGAERYTLFGETKIRKIVSHPVGGTYAQGPMLAKGPPLFHQYLLRLWQSHVDEKPFHAQVPADAIRSP